MKLPHGATAILSDTVGFVADLPTTLVAAFRGTLEEVAEADVILHVRDIARADSEAQARDVAAVLSELGVEPRAPERVIEVWNKIDLLPPAQRPPRLIPAVPGGGPAVVTVSALTGEGLGDLLALIEETAAAARRTYEVRLEGAALARLHRLYEIGEVLDRSDNADGSTTAHVRVAPEKQAAFHKAFPDARAAS